MPLRHFILCDTITSPKQPSSCDLCTNKWIPCCYEVNKCVEYYFGVDAGVTIVSSLELDSKEGFCLYWEICTTESYACYTMSFGQCTNVWQQAFAFAIRNARRVKVVLNWHLSFPMLLKIPRCRKIQSPALSLPMELSRAPVSSEQKS